MLDIFMRLKIFFGPCHGPAGSCRPFIGDKHFPSQASPRELCGGKIVTGFYLIISVSYFSVSRTNVSYSSFIAELVIAATVGVILKRSFETTLPFGPITIIYREKVHP
jgi:hypothetical protein